MNSNEKKIKTREVINDIKVHNAAVNVGDKMKNIGIKTKEKISENIEPNDNTSPEQYAADKVSEKMRAAAEIIAVDSEKVSRKVAGEAKTKIKEKRAEKKDAVNNQIDDREINKPDMADSKGEDKLRNEDKANDKHKNYKNNQKQKNDIKTKSDNGQIKVNNDKPTIKEKTSVLPKTKPQSDPILDEKKKTRQRKLSPPKIKEKGTIKKIGSESQKIKTVSNEANKIKQTKKSFDNTSKSIKTAEKSVKATKNTASKTVESAKKTKQAAKIAVKVADKTVKTTVRIVKATGKAIASGVKSIGAIIAAGGIPAVVVIIIICLIGAIGGTCFGIFFANDKTTGTEKTMSQAISELTSEHYANITAMKTSYSYDLLEVKGDTSIKWKDILAIYAIKITSGEDPLEVVTLNEVKINLLREIMKEMNKISGVVTPKLVTEIKVTTDDKGNSVKQTVYVTKKVLNISIIHLDAKQMALKYKFNDEQNKMLDELMGEEYDDLWNKLIGDSVKSYPSGGSFVGTGIFAWPLTVDGTITSYFGTRSDPITGEISTHGGTDIAAPQGTPILAAADGTVVAATWHNGYGYYVKIKHNNTYSTLYGHCSELHVSAGQKVKQGQLIAKVGSTGYSTGPHLHYEVIQNGVRVDALKFYLNKP